MSPAPTSRDTAAALLILITILFFISGLAIIPYIGIQTDEAIFTGVLFPNSSSWFELSIFKKKVPIMVMTYMGATKAALFTLVFDLFGTSVYSLRVPSLLLGTLTIPLFFLFLRRATGSAATALFGAAILSADSAYLMTTTMDWGPVAIQHACLLAGAYLVLRACQDANNPSLAAGFFLFGLGMWDKALFAWTLSGLAVAAIAILLNPIKRFLRVRRIALAGFFFLLGALPLVIYNVRRPLQTFRGNTTFSAEDLAAKINLPRVTLDGSVFFGFLVEENHAVTPRAGRTPSERLALTISDAVGERRESLGWWAFAVSLLLSPLLLYAPRWRKPVGFVLVFLAVAWAQMLATKGAGGGAHHVILLWPFPLMLVACAAGWLAERTPRPAWTMAAIAAPLCISGYLVHNHYLAQAIRNGSPNVWTDAIFELAREVPKYNPSQVFLTDWGMLDNMRMLQSGSMPLMVGSEPLMRPEPTAEDLRNARFMFESPGAIFVGNTDDRQVFPDVNPRLRKLAESLGYDRELLQVIKDGNGRPAFEVSRFHKRP